MPTNQPPTDPLMTPGEVAHLFRVDAKTVTRWAKTGKLPGIKTLGGHRRFYASTVRTLLKPAADPQEPAA
ncbi:BldC family transcriptional regulator [Micromonospora lupini]|nr:BldC family transcriptional regulator [Micromonospora lupini]MCX5066622.1 BldC family transcriptional regulator [Micromonospora lupini]